MWSLWLRDFPQCTLMIIFMVVLPSWSLQPLRNSNLMSNPAHLFLAPVLPHLPCGWIQSEFITHQTGHQVCSTSCRSEAHKGLFNHTYWRVYRKKITALLTGFPSYRTPFIDSHIPNVLSHFLRHGVPNTEKLCITAVTWKGVAFGSSDLTSKSKNLRAIDPRRNSVVQYRSCLRTGISLIETRRYSLLPPP